MPSDSSSASSSARLQACRTAGSAEKLQQCVRALDDQEVARLARSLEFEGILEGHPPDLLQALRPRLRTLRPPRVMSVERLCWLPVQRFLTDRPAVDPLAPWIVPRRLLHPLFAAMEAQHADLVDQLRRRQLVALFDDDPHIQDQVCNQVGDVAAWFLNHAAPAAPVPGLTAEDRPAVAFMARVLKWHRLIMPNVRYYQQVTRAQGADAVQSLRLHSNWYTVYELLEEQFDLYVLYLFEMTPSPIDVIDAFPFYFDTLEQPQGLAVEWLAYRCNQLATRIADVAVKPLRTQPVERLTEMFEALQTLHRLLERLHRVPLFARRVNGEPVVKGVFDVVMRRVPPDAVERAVDAYLDDVHDALKGPADKQSRAIRLLPRFSVALPTLLALVDTGEKGSRAANARFRLADQIVEIIDRFVKNLELAPATRRAVVPNIGPAIDLCRRLGLAEDAESLLRRLRR